MIQNLESKLFLDSKNYPCTKPREPVEAVTIYPKLMRLLLNKIMSKIKPENLFGGEKSHRNIKCTLCSEEKKNTAFE